MPRIFGVANVHVLLQPDAEHDLPIFYLSKKIDLEGKTLPSRRLWFLIYWRKTSSSWLSQVPVMTSTHYIEHIAAALAAERD